MGWRTAQALTAPTWAGLSPDAYRVANTLAWTVRDTSSETVDACTYWRGHTYLAQLVYAHDDVTTGELKKLQRNIRELLDAGALTLIKPASRGRPPLYQVTLNAPLIPVDKIPSSPVDKPPTRPAQAEKVDRFRPERWTDPAR